MPETAPLRDVDPRMIAGYRLVGRLGEGGQGTVYLGEGPSGVRVAVKVLHARLGEHPAARPRFAREVAAAARVAAFCTARVLAADVEGDLPFLISEYVEGPSLQAYVRDGGPLDAAGLRRLAIGTLTALAAVHEAGIVHRDFKPGNVLLSANGPRVVDFGIARLLDATSTLTSQAIGTPAFMAPEQFGGRPLGPAVDLFAWGCTMVYAATGTPPFGNDTVPAVMARVLHEEPDLGGLTEPLRRMVATCLDKDPDHRPSAPDLLQALLGDAQVTLADAARAAGRVPPPGPPPSPAPPRPVPARPVPARSAPPRSVPARPLSRRAVLIGAGAAVAGAGGVTAAVLLSRGDDAGRTGGRQGAPVSSRDGRVMWEFQIPGDRVDQLIAGVEGVYLISSQRLYALDPRTGRRSWTMDQVYGPLALSPGSSLYTGRVVVGGGGSPALQRIIASPTGRRVWTKRVDVLDSSAIGGDVEVGQNLFLAGRPTDGNKKRVLALSVASGRTRWVRDLPLDPRDGGSGDVLSASPNVVVVNAGRTVYGLAPDTGGQRWRFRLGGSVIGRGCVTGDVVFVANKDANATPTFYALDAATGRPRWTSPLGGDVADGPRYVYDLGPDIGDPTAATPKTAYVTTGGALYALDVTTGRQRWTVRTIPFVTCWGPVGGLIYAYEVNGDTLYALNATTGKIAWSHRTARVWKVVADKSTTYLVAGGDANNDHQTLYALRSAV